MRRLSRNLYVSRRPRPECPRNRINDCLARSTPTPCSEPRSAFHGRSPHPKGLTRPRPRCEPRLPARLSGRACLHGRAPDRHSNPSRPRCGNSQRREEIPGLLMGTTPQNPRRRKCLRPRPRVYWCFRISASFCGCVLVIVKKRR